MDKSGSSQHSLDKRKRHFELRFSRLKRTKLSDHPIHINDSFRTKRIRHSDIYNNINNNNDFNNDTDNDININNNNTTNNNISNKSTKGSASELSYITYKSNTNFSRIDSLKQMQQSLNTRKYDHESNIDLIGSLSNPIVPLLYTKQTENKNINEQYSNNNMYNASGTDSLANNTSTNFFTKPKAIPNSTLPPHISNNSSETLKQFNYEIKKHSDNKNQQLVQQQSGASSFDFELIKKRVDSLVKFSTPLLSASSTYENKNTDIKNSQDTHIYKEQELKKDIEKKVEIELNANEETEDEIYGINSLYLQRQDSVSLPLQSYFEYGGLNNIYSTSPKSDIQSMTKYNRRSSSLMQSINHESNSMPSPTQSLKDKLSSKQPLDDKLSPKQPIKDKLLPKQPVREISPVNSLKDGSSLKQASEDRMYYNKQSSTLIQPINDNHKNDISSPDQPLKDKMNYNKLPTALIQPINNNKLASSPIQSLKDNSLPKQSSKDRSTSIKQDSNESDDRMFKSPVIGHSPIKYSLNNTHNNSNNNDHGFDYFDNNDNDYMNHDDDSENNHQHENFSNIEEEKFISFNDKSRHIPGKSMSSTVSDKVDNIYITKDTANKHDIYMPSTSKTIPAIISPSSSPNITGVRKLPINSKTPYHHSRSNYDELFVESDNMNLEQDETEQDMIEDIIEKYRCINKDANASKKFLNPTEPSTEQLPKHIIRDMFESETDEKLNPTCLSIIEQTSDAYLDQLCHDLKAYADHAGRKDITSDDMKLLMARQRLISNEKNLESLAHENLPRELWDEICTSALADNYIYPNF